MPTKRTGQVIVENKTGEEIYAVSVLHKYSNNYKNNLMWDNVAPNEMTNPQGVQYNTGFMTTGRDWWFVAWVGADGKVHITDPENLRSLVDALEKITIKTASLLKLVKEKRISSVAKGLNAALLETGLLNDGSTAGFKQHILRAEDSSSPTKIVLFKDKVEFVSKSGKSTTGVRTK